MSRWMINCKQYSELVSKSMDSRLSIQDRILARIHALICPPCRYLQKQFSAMRQACRWLPEENDSGEDRDGSVLPDEACDRIQSAIDQLLKQKP